MAQLVHNAFACISCSYQSWLSLLDKAQEDISDILSELDIRSKNIIESYQTFNKTRRGLGKKRLQQISKFYTSALNYITDLKANLMKFNQTLNSIDNQIQSTIDRLTNETYMRCIDAIQDSVTQKKSCVPDIFTAQLDIFDAVRVGIYKCSHKFIQFDLFNGLTSLGLRIPAGTFRKLIACVKGPFINQTQLKTCLQPVSFNHFQ